MENEGVSSVLPEMQGLTTQEMQMQHVLNTRRLDARRDENRNVNSMPLSFL